MAYKLYNREVFQTEIDGKNYTFTCYTQGTSYGFRHICTAGFNNTSVCAYIKKDIIARCSYYNRTWECFKYQTVLRQAIGKLNVSKDIKERLQLVLIDRKEIEEHEKAEKFVKDFESIYNGLSDRNKEILKNSPMIETQEQAEGVLGVMKMMTAFQALGL